MREHSDPGDETTHEESIRFEDEESQSDELYAELAPQVVGQLQMVGARIESMATQAGRHVITLDNGIRAIFVGPIKLERVGDEPDAEPRLELTGQSIQDHFKELEAGQ